MSSSPPADPHGLSVERTPAPFATVTDGEVVASIPDGWRPEPFPPGEGPSAGFYASPDPGRWLKAGSAVEGMAVTWVDATRVGVPSDFYYLAASEPSRWFGEDSCSLLHRRILLDHRPEFMSGRPGSPGDYAVREGGTCVRGSSVLRWASFIAAPGFGRIHRLGITSSGLYDVLAVVPSGPDAADMLHHLIDGASFGGTTIPSFIAAARG